MRTCRSKIKEMRIRNTLEIAKWLPYLVKDLASSKLFN